MNKTEILMNKPVYLGLSILELSKKKNKVKYMSFEMILQNQNLVKNLNCVIWIQTVSLYT